MEFSAYLAAWTFYLLAAAGISLMAWRVLQRWLLLELALLLQCLLMALLFMPWPVLVGQDILAPAFIVALMDSITEAPEAGIRAFAPLVMAMLGSILLAFVLAVLAVLIRLWLRRHKTREAATAPVSPAPGRQSGLSEQAEPRQHSDSGQRAGRVRRGATSSAPEAARGREQHAAVPAKRLRGQEGSSASGSGRREPSRVSTPATRPPEQERSAPARRRRPPSGSSRRGPRD